MPRHKVLHLITHLDVGGAQDNTLLTVERLDRSRFEVHLGGAGGRWESRARDGADRFFPLPCLEREVLTSSHFTAFAEIVRLMREGEYDIVHTHSTHAGILGRLAARIVGVPVVIHTVHGFAFDDRTLSPGVRRFLLFLERACAHLCDNLIMVSELNKQQALQLDIAPEEKMSVIYSGIDLDRFHSGPDVPTLREQLDLTGAQVIVGWVGRLCKQNAPEVFIAAARRLLTAMPDVHFVMVGDGPLWEECRRTTADIPQIHMLGYRSDVPYLLPLFDVFVSTVRWAGLGRAVTEAMIAGRAVVATSVNGVPEIVKHGKTGLLVDPDDPQAIASVVRRLLNDPELAEQLGGCAQELVMPKFSADAMVQRISRLYTGLLSAKGLTAARGSESPRLSTPRLE